METKIQNTVVVVARKFNDIIYATSTEEFQNSSEKRLVIISQHMNQQFPLVELFDSVEYIYSPKITTKGQLKLLYHLYKLRKYFKCDVLFFSNIILLSHLFLSKLSKSDHLILLEDGYMNYRGDMLIRNWRKEFILFLMGIRTNNILNKISTTYLLDPRQAKYYFGTRKKITLQNLSRLSYSGPNLMHKKIFIGQPLYATHGMTIKEYNDLVNKIIKIFDIDYYVPHFYSSDKEKIDCPYLDISKYNLTLEALSFLYSYTIISISSSLLFTTRLINPNIRSIMIQGEHIPNIADKEIFINSGVEIKTINISL